MKRALCSLLLLSLAASGLSLAQEDSVKRIVRPPEPTMEERIEKVDFKDAKVRDVVEFLRGKTRANIVVASGVDAIAVPELKLRNVTPSMTLLALDTATGGRLKLNCHPGDDVWTVNAYWDQAPAAPETITRAFLLASDSNESFEQKVAEVQEVVRKACQLESQASGGEKSVAAPIFEAHAPTRLLLAAGTRDGVEIASQIVAALKGETVASATPVGSIEVTILGEIKKPGVYTLKPGAPFPQLIGQAGDFTASALKNKISVVSKAGAKTIVDITAEPVSYSLQDGDVITVPMRNYNF